MSSSNTHYPLSLTALSRCDEIDLYDVAWLLFKTKWTLMAVTSLFVFVGGIMVLMLPEKWRSDALVITPQYHEISALDNIQSQLKALDIPEAFSPPTL